MALCAVSNLRHSLHSQRKDLPYGTHRWCACFEVHPRTHTVCSLLVRIDVCPRIALASRYREARQRVEVSTHP